MKALEKKHSAYLLLIFVALLVVYVISYVMFRSNHVELWERDNQRYVIFPEDKVCLYYFYRPLMYPDAKISGMRFHIGPHR